MINLCAILVVVSLVLHASHQKNACMYQKLNFRPSFVNSESLSCRVVALRGVASLDMAQVMRGWSEIRELLNRWNLLYRVDTRECYDYVEVMRKKGFDDLDQIVNMNNEDLKALTVEVGMEKEQASKFIDNVRQRYGIKQVCVVLQRGSFFMFV